MATTTQRLNRTAAALAASLLALASGPSVAQDAGTPGAGPVREAGASFDDGAVEALRTHIEAIGGEDAIRSHTRLRRIGSYEGRPFSYKARLEMRSEAPDKQVLVLSEPGGLTLTVGYDGQTAWQRINDQPPQRLGGLQAISVREDAILHRSVEYGTLYSTLSDKGIVENEDGSERYRAVKAVPVDSPRERVMYFDPETGLLRRIRIATLAGDQPRQMDIELREYKEFEGVKYPTRVVQRFLGAPPHAIYEYLRIDVNPEESFDFAPPEDLGGD